MTERRKLAAILAADVVGFSQLAGADEDRTLARLRALRSDLIDPTIAVHNGRVVKRTGDGALVEFRSVVDAVRCALEIQHAMVERNAGVPGGPPHRVPHRRSSRRRGRGERRRPDGRWRQRRRAAGGTSLRRARSACPKTRIGRCAPGSTLRSAISARRSSRTLPSRCGSMRLKSDGRAKPGLRPRFKRRRRTPSPTNHRLQFYRFTT